MNDKDLWPIHIIFLGFLIALILYAFKLMFEEILQSPILLFFVLVVTVGIWVVRKCG
ncbi:hypothetical protein [Novosphingobium aquae]|uniref:Uncharacterized protein n=1 Tax=Novosphingobium aquae TaxID=3133435 RepID=A0ABU8SB36_9SPHN